MKKVIKKNDAKIIYNNMDNLQLYKEDLKNYPESEYIFDGYKIMRSGFGVWCGYVKNFTSIDKNIIEKIAKTDITYEDDEYIGFDYGHSDDYIPLYEQGIYKTLGSNNKNATFKTFEYVKNVLIKIIEEHKK